MGSLILNQPGIIDSLPTALSCLDLERIAISANGRVFPVPPATVINENNITGANTTGFPAACNAAFSETA